MFYATKTQLQVQKKPTSIGDEMNLLEKLIKKPLKGKEWVEQHT